LKPRNSKPKTRKPTQLVASTKLVFNQCAPVYLKEDKHWGCDLDTISEYVEKFDEPDVIELGTGYAWHLANLFLVTSSKPKKVVGIDYSPDMLERARGLLSSVSVGNHPLTEKIELRHGDILHLPYGDASFDVAMMLNNTLGNIAAATFDEARMERKKALREIRRVLRDPGYLILSVYNRARLTEEDKYGEVFELDHEMSNLETSDLVVRFKPTDTPYYSHWFGREEVQGLLYDVSFRVVEVEDRKKRVVVVAQKKHRE